MKMFHLLKDTYLQYNRIDPNKRFDNFITGSSNKLAYEATLKVSDGIFLTIIHFIFMVVLEWEKLICLNSIGLTLKGEK